MLRGLLSFSRRIRNHILDFSWIVRGRINYLIGLGLPATYDPKLHWNCFVETADPEDRQAIYQELRRRGWIQARYHLPDGRLQLAVKDIATGLEAYNAAAKTKALPYGLTKARLFELVARHPSMKVTVFEPHHAERIRLSQIVFNSDGAFRRGVNYQQNHQYKQAVDCYDQAIEKEPDDVRAWCNKILALTQDGEHHTAIEVANTIIARLPQIALLWEAKGLVFTAMNRPIEAGESMSQAISLDAELAKKHETLISAEDKQFQALIAECKRLGRNPETDLDFWFGKFAEFVNASAYNDSMMCLQMAARNGPDYIVMSGEGMMALLPPGHPLLTKELLPEGAQVERLKDFFDRIQDARNKKK